ncbi:MAG TPA: hypothetical protein VHG28_03050 [Longimicrobiaceae bacterium]|nr:hypothetical protein [Longimicrobiaceae bacterium]
MRAWLSVAAALALTAAPSAAQEVVLCKPDRTVQECYARYRPTGGVPAAGPAASDSAALVDEAGRHLQAAPTGTDLSGEGPLTAIRDFLPRLAAALVTPATGDDPTSLGFKANLPLNDGVLFAWGVTAQLAAVVHEPEPSGTLLDSVPVSLRESARERITAGLEPYDDVSLMGSLNLENRVFGRGMRQHARDIGALVQAALESESLTRMDRENQEARRFRQRLDTLVVGGSGLDPTRAGAPECVLRGPGGPRDSGEMRFDCFTPAVQDSIEASIARIAAESTRELRRSEERVRASGILRLAQLINNQPQLNGNGKYRTRRDVVGPDEWTGTARVETGFANLNGLRRHCGGTIRPQCLRTYVDNRAVQGSLSRGDRVWAQIDFTRRSSWGVTLPGDSVDLSLGAATAVTVSGGYGGYFGNPDDGENQDRLDLQARYDFTRGDPIRQDRFVSTLFYTRRLSDQSSALIGLTYANRPEFLGDVDRKLRANLGLTYKLNRSPQAAGESDRAQ